MLALEVERHRGVFNNERAYWEAVTGGETPMTHSALGVDAAWSAAHDSAFALVEGVDARRSRLLAAGASLDRFAEVCGLVGRRARSGLDMQLALESAAAKLDGALPDVVPADMPLSCAPITGRRSADNAISRYFGAAGCGTHSPSARRPGRLGQEFQVAAEAAGYRLATADKSVAAGALVEVYPHPALIRLMGTAKRVPYKVNKTGRYWPGRPYAERFDRVRDQLSQVAARLDRVVEGTLQVFEMLTDSRTTLSGLKPAEDVLDAIISAWVGIVALEGGAEAFGDQVAAIWVPMTEAVQEMAIR